MLRYKKHKRVADGLGTSRVVVMDDTDREVSSFTDRAFRSLSVAEEEPFNDVPRLPSPIRGMPPSTKYHLGIFNLSVRKTQPLAQLPTPPGQHGKWAPTFRPLLKSIRDGEIDKKSNINKLCVPEPRGYRQRSKVSSLIRTFDNIENEIPETSHSPSSLIVPTGANEGNIPEELLQSCVSPKIKAKMELQESFSGGSLPINECLNMHRRTARDVFLESQAENNFRLSESPSSSGSPFPDHARKGLKQRESLRKSCFLHSENSAFKSWSDLNKKMTSGYESESSLPGTPPVLRSATPCSPLLSRTMCGIRTRDAGLASPASTTSSNYDPVQMLKSVPPLPIKRVGKHPKECRSRVSRIPLDTRVQQEEMQVDVVYTLSKHQSRELSKSISPPNICREPVTREDICHLVEQDQVQPKGTPHTQKTVNEKELEVMLLNEKLQSTGRIKTLIQQMEKDTFKDAEPPPGIDHKVNFLEKDDTMGCLSAVIPEVSPSSNNLSQDGSHIPPWRNKVSQKLGKKEKVLSGSITKSGVVTDPRNENMIDGKEDCLEKKPVANSFNITSLLTPVIRRKNINDPVDELPMVITPSPAEPITTKQQDQREVNLYYSRDDYKSKATSLLFNLKDMRKRVKSTYTPAIIVRNGNDINNVVDSKMREETTHSITLTDINKLEIDRENNTYGNIIQNPRQMGGSETTPGFPVNPSDDYLSLSSPQQTTESSGYENGDGVAKHIKTDMLLLKENMSPSILSHHTDHNNTKSANYPSLNLYHKDETVLSAVVTGNTNHTPILVEKAELSLPADNIKKELTSKHVLGESIECSLINGTTLTERNTDDYVRSCHMQSYHSQNLDRQITSDSEDADKREEPRDDKKDDLQYYAVSCVLEESGQSGVKECKADKKGDKKEIEESEKKNKDLVCVEEIQTASITKPNLFHIKNNTIKSSPVTKSVRLPLLRSLSEDSLVCRNEVICCTRDKEIASKVKCDLQEEKERNSGIPATDINETYVSCKGKVREFLSVRPASEIPKQNVDDNLNKQRELEESMDLWKMLCFSNEGWRKNQAGKSETTKEKTNSPEHEVPFFHPVETCVSEVTGPSPECNNLLVQNAMVNGEVANTLMVNAESTCHSPLDHNLLQFEDAITLLQDKAYSTITSPMSESVTCSIMASPMSINSSGFSTALPVFDDFTSPNVTHIITRNGKYVLPASEKATPTLPDIIETESTSYSKNPKEMALEVDPLKMQAGKPPAVPPKTEKALRRAKRLTKKRRKTDGLQKTEDGSFNEPDLILDVPSPGNVIPNPMTTQTDHKLGSSTSSLLQPHRSITSSSNTPFPVTQRKLLQDPESGQYFVVDIPVHLLVKTFFDPETGKYLQVSLPPSERGTPTLVELNSQFMLYPGLSPVPTVSLCSMKGMTGQPNHGSLETGDRTKSWEDPDKEDEYSKVQKYIESICDSCDQSMSDTMHSMEKMPSMSRSPDIISMKDLDDFAMEAIS
ncbi:cardiac-enriched FHL2-interacting protein [Spea bombifrons]|uniref:cardiac-enriched FHL2-interacting protein n=1 Tax=Spea bombifrons TaxID=233779 RepID=UPI00234B3C13|nr:cardiac-enriched FHL2-interacting protein [Spea bombifrons]XP_053306434.1 cardiac-enriched FHL2-interacting protein [Spea bombifrons]